PERFGRVGRTQPRLRAARGGDGGGRVWLRGRTRSRDRTVSGERRGEDGGGGVGAVAGAFPRPGRLGRGSAGGAGAYSGRYRPPGGPGASSVGGGGGRTRRTPRTGTRPAVVRSRA